MAADGQQPDSATFSATFADDAFADFEAAFESAPAVPAIAPDVSDSAFFAATPVPPPLSVSESPNGDAAAAAADAEREEFERQRQKRLQQLEEQRQQQEQQKPAASTASSSSSSWGGWLSSSIPKSLASPAMMDLNLNSLSKMASEQAERAAAAATAATAALQSPNVASSLADFRGKLQKEAEKLQMQSPVATLSSLSKNLEKNLEGLNIMGSGRRSTGGGSAAGEPSSSAAGGEEGGAQEAAASGEQPADEQLDEAAAAAKAEKKAKKEKKKKRKPPETEQEYFDYLMEDKKYDKAAQYAAGSPEQELRTLATIQAFQAAPPAEEGGKAPVLIYFGALLQSEGALKLEEGLELAKPVVQQGQLELLQRWIGQGKLLPTSELADIIREKDVNVALAVYKKADAPSEKMIQCYAELCDVEEVCALCHEAEPPTRPDWLALIGQICASPGGAPRALALDEKLRALPPPPPPPDPSDELALMAYNMNPQRPPTPHRAESVKAFLDHHCVQQATKIALDGLGEGGFDAALQTRLLEDNLSVDKGMGEALLESGSFSSFDEAAVARRCEMLGMHSKALKYYSAPDDVARLLCSDAIDDDAAGKRVGLMSAPDGKATIASLLKNGRGSKVLSKVLSIARAQVDHIGHAQLVSAFEEAGSQSSLLCYLAARVASGTAGDGVTLEYLKCAKKAGRADEIERVTRDRAVSYEPKAVLELLLSDGTSADPRPIINLCDRFEMVEEMAKIFHEQRKLGHLSLYVRKVDPTRTPQVVKGLLDAGCEPPKVVELVNHVDLAVLATDATLATRLVAAFDERPRTQLGLLRPWLEARVAEGLSDDKPDHVALKQALKKAKGFLGSLLG